MAYVTQTRIASFALTERFTEYRAQLAETIAKRKTYRTTVSELDSLTNRELADLGIHRSMIKSIALEAAGIR